MTITALAFDKSVRRIDQDGRLHVEMSNISKANVCPYFGKEIPDSEALGLEDDRIYKLYRDPQELERAAPTFNNLPLLKKHVPVTSDAPWSELVVGSTGTDAEFEAPYLRNSLVVWVQDSIDRIQSNAQRELSSAYHYKADMTPGRTPDGEEYDGVMRDIRGNHVCLVEDGRAGHDVVVGDSTPFELLENRMPKNRQLSSKAQVVRGALAVYLQPKLAQDASVDLRAVLLGTTALNYAEAKPVIAKRLADATKGKLAKDASLSDVNSFLDRLDNEGGEEAAQDAPDMETDDDDAEGDLENVDPEQSGDNPDIEEEDEDEDEEHAEGTVGDDDPLEKIFSLLKTKLAPEDMAELRAMAKQTPAEADGEDAEDPGMVSMRAQARQGKDKMVSKKAMDAALAKSAASISAQMRQQASALRAAENEVRPYIGTLAIAQDSAEAVYRLALDTMGVRTKDVHPTGLRSLLLALPKPSERRRESRQAMDAAADKTFTEKFPDVGRIRVV